MVTGCALFDAPAASAQPMLAGQPHVTGLPGAAHQCPPGAGAHGSGAGGHGAAPHVAAAHVGAAHAVARPSVASNSANASKGRARTNGRGGTPPGQADKAQSLQVDGSATGSSDTVTSRGNSADAPGHSSGSAGSTGGARPSVVIIPAQSGSSGNGQTASGNGTGNPDSRNGNADTKAKSKTDTRSKATKTPKPAKAGKPANLTKPAAKKSGAATAPAGKKGSGRPATPGPVAPADRSARPVRLSLLPVNPLSVAHALTGPGPVSLPFGGSVFQSLGVDPFRLPFSFQRGWAGETIQDSAKLKVPLTLLAAMALFVLVQSLIDRRDPKVSQAPERQGEDSVGFE